MASTMERCFCILLMVFICVCYVKCAVNYIAPEDCSWRAMNAAGTDVQLTCKLRTINSAYDNTNFSLIQPDHTVSLVVLCSEVYFESYLLNNSFQNLHELKELRIEHCKLSDVPNLAFNGLKELKKLVLRTHNTEWGSVALSLASDPLAHMVRLDHLDLSTNNFATLPGRLFCPLKHLKLLNLSRNSLRDIRESGLTEGSHEAKDSSCDLAVEELDISHNHLKLLPERALERFIRLKVLRSHDNDISRVDDKTLDDLKSLQLVDLSNNKLVALPREFFQHSENLKELYLQNNSISILAQGLLKDLQQLLVLDLSRNELTNAWVEIETFSDLIRLVVLNLAHNRLSRIDDSMFKSQYSLQVLHLDHNEIEMITDNAFSSMYNLHTLVLSDNLLTRIDPFTLNGLYVLSMLSIDRNDITTIHEEAFRNCSNSLEDLNLSVNQLTRTPYAIRTLTHLKSLDISGNKIPSIRNASFRGLQQLYKLDLSNNDLGNLTRGVFDDMPAVRIINLHGNNIEEVEDGTFDDTPDLHAVRLDSNNLSNIHGLFSNLRDLLMLNVSANRIAWFDYALIPTGLHWLDIHDNQIAVLGNYFDQKDELKLKTLDASRNLIKSIKSTSFPKGIEIVYLNDNLISHIPPFVFKDTENLTRVDLQNNKIEKMEMNAFRMTKIPDNRPLPEFSISNNPFLCDCNMEWLQRINSLETLREYPRVIDLESSMCRLMYTRDQPYVSLLHAHSAQFLCTYETHCFALCHCCDFDACDCEMICPDNCTCYYDQGWYANIVECTARNHVVMPERIPMDVTELYLDGNSIRILSSHTFIGRKNMKVLFLNSSNIHVINNRTFNGLEALKILHLEDNKLTVLHGYEFERLANLQELYLSRNHISLINNSTFAPLKSLKILHLHDNFVIDFPIWTFAANPRLDEITLAQNFWSCNCQFVEKVRGWLQLSSDSVLDKQSLRCHRNETVGPLFLEYNATTCNNYSATTFVQSKAIEDYVPMLIITISVFLVIIFSIICLFVFRNEVRIWLYSHFGVRLFHKAQTRNDEDKLYDAFVSYSKKDEAFVAQFLAPMLERSGNINIPSYRLCLQHRDLPLGVGTYMGSAMVEAVESSKRSVLILSENFIKSEWCRYELKSAHHEVLRNRKNKRLIVIVLGEIPSRDLDPDIRLYLKSNTYIRWGDKNFWEKLRYAMPDTPSKQQRHYGQYQTNSLSKGRSDVTMAVHI